MAEYSRSYDTTTKVISMAIAAVMLVVAFVPHSIVIGALVALGYVLAYAYSPRGYRVSADAITVRRLIGNVTIPLGNVAEIRRITPDDLTGCVRLWGSGGLFGYYGLFRTTKLGKSTWYVTNRANMVVAIGPDTALFSPDDVDGFLAATDRASHDPTAGDSDYRKSSVPTMAWIGIGVAVFIAGLIAVTSLYHPGPPKYTLANHKLVIHDTFYPFTVKSDEVDISNAHTVDAIADAVWRPVLRTNGIATPHYRAGRFRTAGGQSVMMYRAESRQLVLIPGRNGSMSVLLEVADPEDFLMRLRREMTPPSYN